jgi:hypothetical protein
MIHMLFCFIQNFILFLNKIFMFNANKKKEEIILHELFNENSELSIKINLA